MRGSARLRGLRADRSRYYCWGLRRTWGHILFIPRRFYFQSGIGERLFLPQLNLEVDRVFTGLYRPSGSRFGEERETDSLRFRIGLDINLAYSGVFRLIGAVFVGLGDIEYINEETAIFVHPVDHGVTDGCICCNGEEE